MQLVVSTESPLSKVGDFKSYIDTVTQDDALESIKRLTQMESEDWFRLGMVLSSYKKSQGDIALKDLIGHASENIQINQRKAYYLINIYDKLVASNITPDKVASIGWTKLKEIAELLTLDNVDYWVKICKENNTSQLIALLKSNGTTNEKKAELIDEALDGTKSTPVVEVIPPNSHPNATTIPHVLETALDTHNPFQDTDTHDTGAVVPGSISDFNKYPYAKYVDNFVPTSSSSSEGTMDIVEGVILSEDTYGVSGENTSKASMISEVTPIETPKGNSPAKITMTELVDKLRVYDLSVILSTVTEIFPNLNIIVTESQDETSFD